MEYLKDIIIKSENDIKDFFENDFKDENCYLYLEEGDNNKHVYFKAGDKFYTAHLLIKASNCGTPGYNEIWINNVEIISYHETPKEKIKTRIKKKIDKIIRKKQLEIFNLHKELFELNLNNL